jgi:hypothetical protein
MCRENFTPNGVRTPDFSAHSENLHLLRYRGCSIYPPVTRIRAPDRPARSVAAIRTTLLRLVFHSESTEISHDTEGSSTLIFTVFRIRNCPCVFLVSGNGVYVLMKSLSIRRRGK